MFYRYSQEEWTSWVEDLPRAGINGYTKEEWGNWYEAMLAEPAPEPPEVRADMDGHEEEEQRLNRLDRRMTQILRHEGMRSMDPDGWVPVTALMQELNCERDAIDMIYRRSSNGRRRRYELWDEGTRTMIRAAYKRSYEADGMEHLGIVNRGENREQVGRPSSWRRWTDEEWTARGYRGNIEMECGVCNEQSTMHAMVPCGHLVCQSCSSKPQVTKKCPFCKQPTIGTQVLFKP